METKSAQDQSPDRLLRWAKYAVAGAVLAALAATVAFVTAFHKKGIESAPDAWGQLGDYFGGLLNPAIGLATVVLVFITVRIQAHELRASLAELKQSNQMLEAQFEASSRASFEQTLFAWLKNYHDLLGSITMVVSNVPRYGRRTMHYWYEHGFQAKRVTSDFKSQRMLPLLSSPDELTTDRIEKHLGIKLAAEFIHDADVAYADVYAKWEYQLDGLFRTIYRLIKWIDEHEDLSEDRKWFYVSLVRAQLSWIELTFIFYNGRTDQGQRFVPLCNKYALFDNLNLKSDMALEFLARYTESSPYTPSAFSSDVARREVGKFH